MPKSGQSGIMGGMNLEKLFTGKRLPWVVAAAVAFYLAVMAVALSWPENEKGEWKILRKVDPITDVETVGLLLAADRKFEVDGNECPPALAVTLRGDDVGARIVLPFVPVSGDEIICRWDAQPPHKGDWRIDGENEFIIHFTDPFEDVLAMLANTHKLVLRTKEKSGKLGVVDIEFILDGFAAAMDRANAVK